MRERINGTRINLATASRQELLDMLGHTAVRIQDAKTDYQIIEDYLDRRFGGTDLGIPDMDFSDVPDWPDEEQEPSADVLVNPPTNVIRLSDYRPTYPQGGGPNIA